MEASPNGMALVLKTSGIKPVQVQIFAASAERKLNEEVYYEM